MTPIERVYLSLLKVNSEYHSLYSVIHDKEDYLLKGVDSESDSMYYSLHRQGDKVS